jgi:hypothetical protein
MDHMHHLTEWVFFCLIYSFSNWSRDFLYFSFFFLGFRGNPFKIIGETCLYITLCVTGVYILGIWFPKFSPLVPFLFGGGGALACRCN